MWAVRAAGAGAVLFAVWVSEVLSFLGNGEQARPLNVRGVNVSCRGEHIGVAGEEPAAVLFFEDREGVAGAAH